MIFNTNNAVYRCMETHCASVVHVSEGNERQRSLQWTAWLGLCIKYGSIWRIRSVVTHSQSP